VGWPEIQDAVFDALALATGVERSHIRLAGDAEGARRVLVADVDFELQQRDWEARRTADDGAGLGEVLLVELEVVARVVLWSSTHDAQAGAYAAGFRALRRSHLSVVRDVLAAAGVVLVSTERVLPVKFREDDRVLTGAQFAWVLRHADDEAEGPAPGGAAPRPYFDRISGPQLPRRAVSPSAAPAALAALPWRSLWLGSATDLAGGRVLDGPSAAHDGLAADLPPALSAATVLSPGAPAACSDPDAGYLRPGLAVVVLARGPAAAGDGVVLARAGSWSLRLQGDDWVLEVGGADVGAAPATGGWDLLVLGELAGEVGVWHASGAATSPGATEVGAGPLELGGEGAPAGALVALLGELTVGDPADGLDDVAAALGG
jgi:hypothetical protein